MNIQNAAKQKHTFQQYQNNNLSNIISHNYPNASQTTTKSVTHIKTAINSRRQTKHKSANETHWELQNQITNKTTTTKHKTKENKTEAH